MFKLIKKAAKAYDTNIQATYRPVFRDNADEVITVTYCIIAISTIQYVIDWKKYGYRKARNNNAKAALGMVIWQITKVPEVEQKISAALEKLSDKLSA